MARTPLLLLLFPARAANAARAYAKELQRIADHPGATLYQKNLWSAQIEEMSDFIKSPHSTRMLIRKWNDLKWSIVGTGGYTGLLTGHLSTRRKLELGYDEKLAVAENQFRRYFHT